MQHCSQWLNGGKTRGVGIGQSGATTILLAIRHHRHNDTLVVEMFGKGVHHLSRGQVKDLGVLNGRLNQDVAVAKVGIAPGSTQLVVLDGRLRKITQVVLHAIGTRYIVGKFALVELHITMGGPRSYRFAQRDCATR